MLDIISYDHGLDSTDACGQCVSSGSQGAEGRVAACQFPAGLRRSALRETGEKPGPSVPLSRNVDAELADRVLRGDDDAFDALFRKYQGLVHVVIFRVIGCAQTVEDLVQETFLKVFVHLPDLEEPGRFRSWLTRIAANCARDHLRKTRPRERVLNESDPFGSDPFAACVIPCGGNPTVNEAVEAGEWREKAVQEINALPSPYRHVAQMRYLGEATYPEIARELDIPRETVKRRSGRARVMLQGRLKEWDIRDEGRRQKDECPG